MHVPEESRKRTEWGSRSGRKVVRWAFLGGTFGAVGLVRFGA
jgi:hypothetical protein